MRCEIMKPFQHGDTMRERGWCECNEYLTVFDERRQSKFLLRENGLACFIFKRPWLRLICWLVLHKFITFTSLFSGLLMFLTFFILSYSHKARQYRIRCHQQFSLSIRKYVLNLGLLVLWYVFLRYSFRDQLEWPGRLK